MTHELLTTELKGIGSKITELLRHIQAMKQHTLPIPNNYKHREDCQGIHWEVKCIGCAKGWVAETKREKEELTQAVEQFVGQIAHLDEQYQTLSILSQELTSASLAVVSLLPAVEAESLQKAICALQQRFAIAPLEQLLRVSESSPTESDAEPNSESNLENNTIATTTEPTPSSESASIAVVELTEETQAEEAEVITANGSPDAPENTPENNGNDSVIEAVIPQSTSNGSKPTPDKKDTKGKKSSPQKA
ncbi:hypothetical protein [Allocoleopsis franciscana]|uniref:Uncharacterized protein n=1 Tax=Allocoleopsis franciscana PCC 7113 TaxID=1173027 RepID=K9WNR1_9CYAN|nr:hypothetical protein [Allocoleopsis franciscana]AFZ22040.1 hypothetical protein Mic7113_6460 [Allocoleopsis franciscana PCC 7113]